ncbi:MucR family transcriptional regulator [Pararhizobium sp. BT-229]|uniref:MucR family transcriptional regulator n=1 Tax=Pararhizobium sp. BT-229 TaxID=2986923 RepID=UPI0021F72699|nr:MucR family transcriptional regulator [Pararhizobium sp. BT-229]MCV9965037.1 MucR family transcriptional regulator [Pararhizobium sp. BT-229]
MSGNRGGKVRIKTWRVPRPAPEPPALWALRRKGVEIDSLTQVDAWVGEWGSARGALEALTGRELRGRRPEFVKILEAAADDEERREVDELIEAGEYKFSDIPRTPVAPIDGSVTDDYIVCLVDGSRRTMLSRYLKAKFDMTPREYIIHYGLPSDYPMTATRYRDTKSDLAVHQGLGRKGKVRE